MEKFDAVLNTNHIIDWLKQKFADYGPEAKAVIGMSGGKDSTIACAFLVQALGADRVIGVIMPDGYMVDEGLAQTICESFGIKHSIIPIDGITSKFYEAYSNCFDNEINSTILTNTPARIRMSMLYAVAASCHGRVVNTCNRSETEIGWFTKWGDGVGDFSILENYTVSEVIEMGLELYERGVIADSHWITKIPDDGMCGQSDEEKFGFSYEALDNYLTYGIVPDINAMTKIRTMINNSRHKKNVYIDSPAKLSVEEKVWF